jgi:integrase
MARARRGRGEHGIYQRGSDGLWVGSLSLGYDASGKRKRRVVYGATKREVQEKIDRLKVDAAAGVAAEPNRMTVKDLLDQWLELEVKPNRAPATHKSYSDTARLHINPHIGGVRLQDLDSVRVAGLYSTLEKNGVPGRTRELVHSVLRRVLKRAVAWKLKGFNPAAEVERPKVVRRDIPAISPEQANALLDAATGHRLEALFVFAVASGMREGELFALRWQDVEVSTGQVHVRHSLEELNGNLRLKEPKSKAGKRAVTLPGMAREALVEHRKRMLVEGHYGPDRPVFPDTEGGWLRKSNFLRNVYAPLLSAAGLTGIRFHDWRHYHASQLVELGESVKVIQERIGHADVATTLRFYVHPRQEAHKAAADRFDAAFRAMKGKNKTQTGA